MENLRDVRFRMRAIRQTLQVTRAMKLISTAKLRKGRRVLENMEPYFSMIEKTMFDILSGAGMDGSKFLKAVESENESRAAVLIITSDKGFAGGYNANIFRHANQLCARLKNPVLMLSGAIGYRYFSHSPWPIVENFSFQSGLPEMHDAEEMAEYIVSQFLWGIFSEVHIVYTHMFSSIKLVPVERQLLPLSEEKMQKGFERSGGRRARLHLEYLPSHEEVFNHLVPLYVKGIVYGSLVEAYASEQSARMTAMDEAGKNAGEILDDLQIHYNRVRQAAITQEMSEIIGGAAALGN